MIRIESQPNILLDQLRIGDKLTIETEPDDSHNIKRGSLYVKTPSRYRYINPIRTSRRPMELKYYGGSLISDDFAGSVFYYKGSTPDGGQSMVARNAIYRTGYMHLVYEPEDENEQMQEFIAGPIKFVNIERLDEKGEYQAIEPSNLPEFNPQSSPEYENFDSFFKLLLGKKDGVTKNWDNDKKVFTDVIFHDNTGKTYRLYRRTDTHSKRVIYQLEIAEGVDWRKINPLLPIRHFNPTSIRTYLASNDPVYNGAFAIEVSQTNGFSQVSHDQGPIVEISPDNAVSFDTQSMHGMTRGQRKKIVDRVRTQVDNQSITITHGNSTRSFDRHPDLEMLTDQINSQKVPIFSRLFR